MEEDPKTIDFEITFFEKLLTKHPDYVEALKPLAECYTRKGLYEKGLAVDLRLLRLVPEDPVVVYNLACSLALTGSPDEALERLREAIRLGYDDLEHMRRDPDLESLRSHPGFIALFPPH